MVPGVAGSNPVIRPRNKKSPNGRFFISVQGYGFEPAKKPFEPAKKAVRTAAKRRTEVRRLCTRTILQGDEAQRNNPVIRPSYKHTGVSAGIFITSVGSGFEPRFEYSAPVIAKEYDQRWKRWRTTVAIQCNMSAGERPQCFLFTGSPRFARRGGLFHCAGLGVFICAGGVCIGHPNRCIHNT